MNFNPLPIVLSLVGIYFLIKLRFFFILHPVRTIKKTFNSVKDAKAFKSLTLALGGTLGVGNVFGVALGIIIGGAGSVFWLFVSMLFALAVKYCEVVIVSDNLYHDGDSHGGMYYVIKNSFSRIGKAMSALYSAAVILLSFFMGAALQSSTVCESASAVSALPPMLISAVFAFFVLICIIGGADKIEKISVFVIPLTTVVYIITTFTLIVVNVYKLPEVLLNIINSAFTPSGAIGGIAGFLFSRPFYEGFARGLLSNEAGAGTSSMAHARSGILNPASAGLMGIFEVWFDTGLICMLTAFSILMSVSDMAYFEGGMQLVMHAVGTLYGNVGSYTIMLSVFAFALATVICWYYYGRESFVSLFGKRHSYAYMLIFILFVLFGGILPSGRAVGIIDILMTVITLLTLSALIKNSDRIIALSERGGVIDYSYKRLKIKGSVSRRAELRRRP